ncbi:MAG: ATP-binding protein [Proteobacteria bacterium]|nr:ATP-binding protein [Pseudomonadota bacterium]MCP4918047.1 ATP-binding protein [Pseudomonadota bacterium]
MFRLIAQRKRQRIRLEGSCDGLSYERLRVTRILDNLLSNALKFSPLDSEVVVEVSVRDDVVRIRVLDQGLGFSRSDRTNALLSDRCGVARAAESPQSMGLGLHAVYRAVTAMGGTIELLTRPSGGEVVVSLPRAAPAQDTPAPMAH